MTSAKTKSQRLHRLSHPGAPKYLFLNVSRASQSNSAGLNSSSPPCMALLEPWPQECCHRHLSRHRTRRMTLEDCPDYRTYHAPTLSVAFITQPLRAPADPASLCPEPRDPCLWPHTLFQTLFLHMLFRVCRNAHSLLLIRVNTSYPPRFHSGLVLSSFFLPDSPRS